MLPNTIFNSHPHIPKLPIHFPFHFSHNFKLCATTSHSESDSDSFTVSYLINTVGLTPQKNPIQFSPSSETTVFQTPALRKSS
ncbi:unnamed protein product [Lathyrus sativus]|nr:unnamed protein product [Lathyrus sativus]